MPNPETRQLRISGQVQGVGFRPFIYRLARQYGLRGQVANRSSHVEIVLQGQPGKLDKVTADIRRLAPGRIDTIHSSVFDAPRFDSFTIGASEPDAGIAGALLNDRAMCSACRTEFLDPVNRRYHYPFIACTHCGPRFSITQRLPYDRHHTAWRDFPPCARCQAEHGDDSNRRFHMVGISCPDCGPSLYTAANSTTDAALEEAAAVLRDGGIVAVKGSAGYQLMVDSGNADAVEKLRRRKRRRKPFAVLAPGLDWVREHARVDDTEAEALQSEAAPIVLLGSSNELANTVAPGTNLLGAMLPNSGIQLRLLALTAGALVATSGNLSESPLIFDSTEAEALLGPLADCLLHHNLTLCQGLDDSMLRVIGNRPVTLRLGRGLAPALHALDSPRKLQGCGAQLKANISLLGRGLLVSGPYIGDLDAASARQRYRSQKASLGKFFQLEHVEEITDLHPDYGSTIDADYRAHSVPHHVAHAMACWFEHRQSVKPPFLALTWDGIGLGPDGSLWGGEFLRFDHTFHWRRVASLRPFMVPAGPELARQPRRVADALAGQAVSGPAINCSSVGRLIEGVAVLAGLSPENDYEAQLAMHWEALASQAESGAKMEFCTAHGELDWRPLLPVISDQSQPIANRALGFHQALARGAAQLCQQQGSANVVLSGGVFQNRLLAELLLGELQSAGIRGLTHQAVPPNDGGISLGQCVAVAFNVHAQSETVSKCA